LPATRPKRPPKDGLTPTSRAWLKAVNATHETDASALQLLLLAAHALDQTNAARAVIDREGATYLDRFGAPRTRPEVAVERDSRLAFLRILRQLGLPS
jgi:hypothetical protein